MQRKPTSERANHHPAYLICNAQGVTISQVAAYIQRSDGVVYKLGVNDTLRLTAIAAGVRVLTNGSGR